MKRGMVIFSAAALMFAMAGRPAFAQMPMGAAAGNADESYFDSHPDVAHRLAKNPSLIDNQQWVDAHPGLHEYLHDHPNVRHDFKSHPYRFMHRSEKWNKNHE